MQKRHSLVYHITLFVLAQLIWLLILVLWIYWYASNYIIFKKVGEQISPTLIAGRTSYFALFFGLILLLLITILISMLFKYLYGQITLHRLYGNFISNVSHELKSPLSSIQLHLETLLFRDMSVAQQKTFITILLEDIGRLHLLIDTILEISGLEQKRNLYRYSVHPVEPLIDTLACKAKEFFSLPEDAITITGQAHCTCVIDQKAMQTVFNNLVDNAIKYSVKQVPLLIRLTVTRKWFIMEFVDYGIGVLPSEQQKIFQKFYRSQRKNSPNVKGVGLGLYMVREIIRAHGGRVSAASEGVDQGTTFRVELPIYLMTKKRFIKKLLRITCRKKMED